MYIKKWPKILVVPAHLLAMPSLCFMCLVSNRARYVLILTFEHLLCTDFRNDFIDPLVERTFDFMLLVCTRGSIQAWRKPLLVKLFRLSTQSMPGCEKLCLKNTVFLATRGEVLLKSPTFERVVQCVGFGLVLLCHRILSGRDFDFSLRVGYFQKKKNIAGLKLAVFVRFRGKKLAWSVSSSWGICEVIVKFLKAYHGIHFGP